ncbi:MAG: HlyD family efflux transporter periplasmic adaptor subunit, partial [Planctomycetes bacterium]|nr:HlyD family efflux transporter periplasmic adaptor subunit [Planctomycetota bacterium]
DSLISSSARPLRMRMRRDLTVREHQYQGQAAWVIKDPVGLKYFRLRDEEFAILQWLDGRQTLDGLKEQYEDRFPPRKITHEDIARFVGTLHQSGLVTSLLPDQGRQLKRRHDERKRQQLISTLTNILSIRWRGIDPHRILTWMLPYVRWFFTPLAAAASLMLGLSAISLVLVHLDAFHARLPAFQEFFAAGNWIYLASALAVTKVCHELGHALCCRRFGGECHEIGLMMLVLTPCLYCDTSDSWMLKSKWQRAAIGAAGMYVELVIASLATFIWWFSTPGMLNHLMLSTMFVCSVTTLVFNANPLLRYDGYYILSDILEIPNLRQKATSIVSRKLGAWCLGLEEPKDRYLPRHGRGWFALYTVASVVYRWMVVGAILYFLYRVLEPYGLKAIGQAFAVFALCGMVGQPLWSLKKFFAVPGRIDKIKWPRFGVSLGLVAGLLLFALLVPLPHRVYCPLEVQPHDAKQVFVEVPGVLRNVQVHAGQQVAAGTLLAELDNLDARLEASKLQGEREENRAKLASLRRQRHSHETAGKEADLQISETLEALQSIEQQLAKRKRDLARLTLVSPCAGTVLPPPMVKGNPHVEGGLASWSGTPLDRRNKGTWLTEGQQVCFVGDPSQYEAVLVVDQADVPFLQDGQEVVLMLDELSGRTVKGQIAEIARVNLKTSSQRLSAKHGGQLDTRADPETGQEHPASPSYQARVVIDNQDRVLRLGIKGEARISVAAETLFTKLWRYVTRTFYFKL